MNEFTKNLSDFDYWTTPIKGLYRYCILQVVAMKFISYD